MESIKQPEEEPREGEVRMIGGQSYRWTKTAWTIQEYYSHDGPGWDHRARALQKYGVQSPAELPSDPYFDWELVEE
jgi:hypothetical protein